MRLKSAKFAFYSFSSLGHVVSWSCGLETGESGSSRYLMSKNFGHPVTHVQKLQISLLMLIMDFCPSPLHWEKKYLLLSPESGFFGLF